MPSSHKTCGNLNCAVCRNNLPFELPPDIPLALKERRLALFAGAGISTEAQGVFPSTFYQEIVDELGLAPSADRSFPAVMSDFSMRRGRRELLVRIKKRFDYLDSFPEVRESASRFHRSLSTIPFLEQIFTTNWDELFERECCATPIVTGADYSFWDLPGRKVFKLHGSAAQYGSIVATTEDYAECSARLSSGLIGSSLKLALATKTILFVGYSARDADFLNVLNIVRTDLGTSLTPPMYAITLSEDDKKRLESLGIIVIMTDATFFLKHLKDHLVRETFMLDESWIDDLSLLLPIVLEAHRAASERFKCVKYPAMLYCLNYQDGLIHGIELLLARSKSGECSHRCDLTSKLRTYENLRVENRRARRYANVAYIEGYFNALCLPLAATTAERFAVPLYYLMGLKRDIKSISKLSSALARSRHLHNGAYQQAQAVVKRLGNDPGIVLHHPPWL
jgi:hypothetical protein